HSGGGKWEWLSATVSLEAGTTEVLRPHLFNVGPGSVEIYAPHLVAGLIVKPLASPQPDEIHSTPALVAAEVEPPKGEAFDLQQYRVNRPHNFTSIYRDPL